jgi:hypothetical protein
MSLAGLTIPLSNSANGAEYKARQAREARRPWLRYKRSATALKRVEYYFGLSGLRAVLMDVTQGDALRACPGLSYSAPLALFGLSAQSTGYLE